MGCWAARRTGRCATATATATATRWALSAEIDFGAHPELLEAFPFPHRLALDVALRRRTLTVRTTLTATGEHAVPVSFGFHPYLRLPGVAREDWHVELPAMRHLQLDARSIPTGASRPVAGSSRPAGRAHLRRRLRRRTRWRASSSSPAAGAASPCGSSRAIRPHRSSRRRRDDVICFEPMTAPTNALNSGDRLSLVAPGERYTATFSITVERP